MKTVKEMAEESAIKHDFVDHDTPQSGCIGGTAFKAGFIAGFSAAREAFFVHDQGKCVNCASGKITLFVKSPRCENCQTK